MTTITLKVVNQNNNIKLTKVTAGAGYVPYPAGYVPYPQSTPSITSQAINDLTSYSNTQQVMTFIEQAVANIHVSDISDVILSTNPPANNSSLVYNSNNNKYIVEQMPVDGGTF